MDYMDLLMDLTSVPAVSGHERKLSILLKEFFSKYCDSVGIDRFYSVIGIKKGYGEKRKKIMVTAHLDEVGLMVKSIDEKGFIKFTSIGGIDSKILLAQEVVIHGKKDIPGIIGAKPPHLLKDEEIKKSVKIEDLYIDAGLTLEKIREYVSIGDIITFHSRPAMLENNKISSKSSDNRCSIAAVIEIMKQLEKIKHRHDIFFAATAQEEVELTGSITSAYNINPDFAVVIDACHGDMPDVPKEEVYPLGKGPAIGIGPILNKNLTGKLMDTAKKFNIPYQIDVEPGDTGTEAWAAQVSRSGIPTVLVSIPVRYMHTPVETFHVDDVSNAGYLLAKFFEFLEDLEVA